MAERNAPNVSHHLTLRVRLGHDCLAQARAARVPHAKAHLSSQSAWQHQTTSREAAKAAPEIGSSRPAGSATRDAGQPGQENGGRRWDKIRPTQRTTCSWSTSIHPKHWKHRKHPPPVRRVWIPKPGKAEKRPLGIPTMMERAKQASRQARPEPAWEAVFEPNSYGFRPGRSCHDAIGAIFNGIRYKAEICVRCRSSKDASITSTMKLFSRS